MHDSIFLYYLWLVTLTLAFSSSLTFYKFYTKIRKTLIGETAFYVSLSFILWGIAASLLMIPSIAEVSNYTGIFLIVASLASLIALRSAYSEAVIQGILAPNSVSEVESQEFRIIVYPGAVLSGLALAIGSAGVLRFVADNPFLNEVMDGMSILTSLGFIFIAVPLTLSSLPKFSYRLLYSGAGLMFFIAFAALAGHWTGIQVLYAPLPGGGTSVSTAIGFVVICIWVATMRWQGLKGKIARLTLSVSVLTVASLALLGYISHLPTLYSAASFAHLSVPTALCFALIGSALFWHAWKKL